MSKFTVCPKEKCTACGTCSKVCPVSCIEMKLDVNCNLVPMIDDEKCIHCQKCVRTCPINQSSSFHEIISLYAGFSKDKKIRNASASGGLAMEFYILAMELGYSCYGAILNSENKVVFKKATCQRDLLDFQNSKYVYSSASGIFSSVKDDLKSGKNVLFIGMPCQCMGLKNYLHQDYENLILIDILCHGMAPEDYWLNHLADLQKKYKLGKITKIYFRKNNIYGLFLEDEFGKKVNKNHYYDMYSVGYHSALIYQEGCYQCIFSQKLRVGDLSLSDFFHLENDLELCKEEKKGVSAIFLNSQKGEVFFHQFNKNLSVFKRDKDQMMKSNPQLIHPSIRNSKRDEFLINVKTMNFSDAVFKTLKPYIYKIRMKLFLKRLIPENLKIQLKKLMKRK